MKQMVVNVPNKLTIAIKHFNSFSCQPKKIFPNVACLQRTVFVQRMNSSYRQVDPL